MGARRTVDRASGTTWAGRRWSARARDAYSPPPGSDDDRSPFPIPDCDCPEVIDYLTAAANDACGGNECRARDFTYGHNSVGGCTLEFSCFDNTPPYDAGCPQERAMVAGGGHCARRVDPPPPPKDNSVDEAAFGLDDCEQPLRWSCNAPKVGAGPEPSVRRAREQISIVVDDESVDERDSLFGAFLPKTICGMRVSEIKDAIYTAWGYVLANSDLPEYALGRALIPVLFSGEKAVFPSLCGEAGNVTAANESEYLDGIRAAVTAYLEAGRKEFQVDLSLDLSVDYSASYRAPCDTTIDARAVRGPGEIELPATRTNNLGRAVAAGADASAALPYILNVAATMLHELVHAEDLGECYQDGGTEEMGPGGVLVASGRERGDCFPAGRTGGLLRSLVRQRYGV